MEEIVSEGGRETRGASGSSGSASGSSGSSAQQNFQHSANSYFPQFQSSSFLQSNTYCQTVSPGMLQHTTPLPSLFCPPADPLTFTDQSLSSLPGVEECPNLPHNIYPLCAITAGSSAISSDNGVRNKRHSTPATLLWLDQHYHLSEGICIPRNSVYFNYVDFCSKNRMTPVNAASFGKIIRQMFPNLTTRRLGTRGQSRYHYYGLAVKETSPYFNPNITRKESFPQSDRSSSLTMSKTSSLGSIVLTQSSPAPVFPTIKDFHLPHSVPADRLNTFLTMYSVVAVCDSVLYRAALKAVIPSPTQSGAEFTRTTLNTFAVEFPLIVKNSTNPHADLLKQVRWKLASQFSKLLLRRISVNLCISSISPIILSTCGTRILQDWSRLQVPLITSEVALNFQLAPPEIVNTLLSEWSSLVGAARRLGEVCVWLTAVVDRLVCRNTSLGDVRTAGSLFVAAWQEFSKVLLRRVTDMEVTSSGEIKQLTKLFTELILHEVENILLEETSKDLLSCVSQSSVPVMQDLIFVESLPLSLVLRDSLTEERDQITPDSTQATPYTEGCYNWHQPGPGPNNSTFSD